MSSVLAQLVYEYNRKNNIISECEYYRRKKEYLTFCGTQEDKEYKDITRKFNNQQKKRIINGKKQ